MEFRDSFESLMKENDTDVKEISKRTGIYDTTLYKYLHGAFPDVKTAVILANDFNCSVNYLMGLDDSPDTTKFKDTYDVSLFSDRYDKLLKENNVTHYKLSRDNGLNYSSHYAWQRGTIPNMTSLIIIATYFGVSIDYLIGREK